MNDHTALPEPPASPLLGEADLAYFEWLLVPMWVFDVQSMAIPWANTAGLALWMAPSLEVLRQRDFSDATPAVRARLAATLQQHAAGRLLRESWTLYPLGQPFTSILLSRGLLLADGRQAILFCSEPLAASYDASMLRGTEALQHTPVRVSLHRLDDCLPVMRNPAAAAAFGPVDEAATGDPLLQLFDDPALAATVRATVRAGHVHEGDALLHTTAGPRWHGIDARAVRDPVTGVAMLQFSARDISDVRAALAALEAARDAAQAASQAKSRFLANMSHEIRTPMNGVLGLTELVLATTLDERQRHFLALAHQSAKSLMRTIGDILDISKIEAEKLVLDPMPMALRDTLCQALSPLQIEAAQRGLALRWAVEGDVPDALVVDAIRWRQVLLNLVGNALKFTEQGAVTVTLSGAERDNHGLLLTCRVADTGIGMSPEQLAVVFEPFTQADDSITRRYGGTGLGLAIAHQLVQMMGGHLDVASTVGQGTVFTFCVPVAFAASLAI
jgi:signal transduction histidine kinase